jgi:catechol 2,3-dioxygenase-like lactoylglutathione lyase family enzyme
MTPRFDLIGLVVQDMPASLAFYRHLGMSIPPEMDTEAHVEVVLAGGLRFAWDTVTLIQSFDDHWTPPAGGHRVGLAFLCESAAEVDAIYARLTGLGYRSHKAPWDAFWGQRYAQILDPDDNVVDLFAPL